MPLNDPVPSNAIDVFRRNTEDTDSIVNDNGVSVTTRTGREDLTLAEINRRAKAAIAAAGYINSGDFNTGATLTEYNEILYWDSANGGDDTYYRWDGVLPKSVPAASAPSDDGFGDGLWVAVDLNAKQQGFTSLQEVVDNEFLHVGYKGRIQGIGDFEIVATNPSGSYVASENGFIKPIGEAVNFKLYSDLVNAASDKYAIVDSSTSFSDPTTPDVSSMDVTTTGDVRGMTVETTITARDKDGKFIGLAHNYNEEKRNPSGVTPKITTGDFNSPPLSDASPVTSVDVMAHFYNDFGREAVRQSNGGLGWTGWYTWEWNHTDNVNYTDKRHPILGWYRGDDPKVLDWQCYWLREAGVKGVIPQLTSIDTSTWTSDADPFYWAYQMFENAPNFKGLKYSVAGPASGTQVDFEAGWSGIQTDIYDVYDNYHIVNINGKSYGSIYIHDVGTVRSGVFSTDADFESWLKDWSDYFKGKGLDGVFVYGRNASYYTASANRSRYKSTLSINDVVMCETGYGDFTGSYTSPTVYADYVNNFEIAYNSAKYRTLPNIMTARESQSPHPSGWTTGGSTPELFQKAVTLAAKGAVSNNTIPNIVTVYNVSEWAEGGESLQPTLGDGFGYLNAVRAAEVAASDDKTIPFEGSFIFRVDGATTNIDPLRDYAEIWSSFNVTMNSATFQPTIADGYEGQEITLINTANAGSFNITLHDESTTAGTNLFLSAGSVTLSPWDSIKLKFYGSKGWVEV